MLWVYITFPCYWFATKKIETKLTQMAKQDRSSLMTENDVEFLRTIGIEADLETLRNGGRKSENDKMKIGII